MTWPPHVATATRPPDSTSGDVSLGDPRVLCHRSRPVAGSKARSRPPEGGDDQGPVDPRRGRGHGLVQMPPPQDAAVEGVEGHQSAAGGRHPGRPGMSHRRELDQVVHADRVDRAQRRPQADAAGVLGARGEAPYIDQPDPTGHRLTRR